MGNGKCDLGSAVPIGKALTPLTIIHQDDVAEVGFSCINADFQRHSSSQLQEEPLMRFLSFWFDML